MVRRRYGCSGILWPCSEPGRWRSAFLLLRPATMPTSMLLTRNRISHRTGLLGGADTQAADRREGRLFIGLALFGR